MRQLAGTGKGWPLFLYGGVGVGKTCAALWLCDKAGWNCYYWPAPLFHGLVIDGKEPAWEWWKLGKLVVLDELGRREKESPAMCDTVQRCLDMRLGKPTIYISNIGLEAMASAYDDRIASRLAAGTVYHLSGPDRRIGDDNERV